MRIIKAGLSRKAPDLVGKAEHVEEKMTGNANFPTPTPSVDELKNARLTLVSAIAAAQNKGLAEVATRNAAATKLAEILTALSRYVNSASGGDVTKAVSSGFELAQRRNPIEQLNAPAKFEGRTATIQGQIDLRWKPVFGARLYFVYMCEGDPAGEGKWQQIGMVSHGRFVAQGLEPLKMYSFRVTPVGRIGEGPVSEIVTARAA